MTEFLHIALGFPTVLFTVPLGVALLYWAVAIVGGIDLEALQGADALDGAAEALDGALDGAVDGVADALDGALDGVADAADGALDGAADALDGAADGAELDAADALDHDGGVLVWLSTALRLGKVPLTVVVTLLLFWGWVTSFLVAWLFLHPLAGLLTGLGAGVVGLALSLVAGTALTNVSARPLEPVFRSAPGRRAASLAGEVCTVRTGRVDGRFGEALLTLGGDDLLLQVRCDVPNHLSRGASALIVHFDPQREAYVVEPLGQPNRET